MMSWKNFFHINIKDLKELYRKDHYNFMYLTLVIYYRLRSKRVHYQSKHVHRNYVCLFLFFQVGNGRKDPRLCLTLGADIAHHVTASNIGFS